MAALLGIAAGTVAAFLVNTAASIALSYGVSLLSKKLAGDPKQVKTQGGSILEVRYGEDTPETVALGLVCTAGVLRYDNTYGSANKNWQRVYELSSFYSTSLERVAINGEWVTLGSVDATLGFPVTSGDYSGQVWVKFLDGTQSAADAYLTANDNPDGRWTSDHIGLGLTYAIVTMRYDKEALTSPLDFRFEFKGAPLYDWRLDTTAGGSGSHRWATRSTWAWSANPILMDYAYRRGAFKYGTDIFCGMEMSSAELPLTQYTAAANICDETVEGEDRYTCSIFLDATRSHRENLEDILQSCAGMNADGINVSYPIINASQTPVATLSRADLVDGEEYTFDRDGSFGDIVNSVNGTYTEPNFTYESTGYGEQTLSALVTLDRRSLDAELSFPMVTSKRQAEQLASIYLSETRYAANKSCVVHPKWMVLDVGDWITWTDDEDGVDRDYQILSMTVFDLESGIPRAVALQLQERDASIYDGTGPAAPPTRATGPGAPTYLNEVATFAVIPYAIEGDGGAFFPAFRASWDAIDDETVSGVKVEWRPRDQVSPPVFSVTVPFDQTVVILEEGVVADTVYEVRTQLLATPYRTTVASAWVEVTSGSRTIDFEVRLSELSADVLATLAQYRTDLNKLFQANGSRLSESMLADIQANNRGNLAIARAGEATALVYNEQTLRASADEALASTIEVVQASLNNNIAAVFQEQIARTDADSANAALISAVSATADAGTASGLYKLEATTAPIGVTARFGVYLRATVGGSYEAEAAEYLEIKDGTTRKVINADQTVIANSSGTIYALFESGGTYLDNARIHNLTASNITAGTITATEIAAATITTSNLVVDSLSNQQSASAAYSSSTTTTSTSWATLDSMSVTITVAANAKLLIIGNVNVTGDPTQISMQIADGGVGIGGDDTQYGFWGNNQEVGGGFITLFHLVTGVSGSKTYTIEWARTGGGTTATARTRQLIVLQLLR